MKNTKHINLIRKDSKADVLSRNEKKVLRKIGIDNKETWVHRVMSIILQ